MNFSDEEINEFIVEATEMLDLAESTILSRHNSENFSKVYEALFRIFHSLKGGGAVLGLDSLQKIMHRLEDQLSQFKTRSAFSETEASYFLEGIDSARQILSGKEVGDFDKKPGPLTTENTKIPSTSATDTTSSPPSLARSTNSTPPSSSTAPISDKTSRKGLAYVVDDEPDILDILSDLLRQAEIECETFSSPKELIERARKVAPDVILTDMKMPEMSGLDLLHQVHEFKPDLPVIVVSGFLNTKTLLECLEQGLYAAIQKPFDPQALITYTLSAIRHYHMTIAFKRSMNLIIYQFADIEDVLLTQGKEDIAKLARQELTHLMQQWQKLTLRK